MKRRSFLGLAGAGLISQSTLLAANGCDMDDELAIRPKTMPAKDEDIPSMVAEEIIKYAKIVKNSGRPFTPRAIAIPLCTEPLRMVLAIDQPAARDLPEPKYPLGWLIEKAAIDREHADLLSLGVRYAMVESLPRWCNPQPFPAGGLAHEPVRIVSPRYIWDVDGAHFDNTHERRLMLALVNATLGPVHEIRARHKHMPAQLDLAVDGLHCFVKREAYMLEFFSWCHVIEQSAIVEIPGGLQYENYC
jgi:hypothetical protein